MLVHTISIHLGPTTPTTLEPTTQSVKRNGTKSTVHVAVKEGSHILYPVSITVPPLPVYSHHQYDDNSPGVSFLGDPLEYAVQSEPVTISPPGLGISMTIPQDAVPPEEQVNVTIRQCLAGSFQYPEGFEPLSAIYHIPVSDDSSFQKDVEVEFEHFGQLETEEQASKMTFFDAKSSPVVVGGRNVFKFSPVKGGRFAVGGSHCTYSSKHFGFLCAGTEKSSETRELHVYQLHQWYGYSYHYCMFTEALTLPFSSHMLLYALSMIGKRYVVLNSYTQDTDLHHAAIAISVDNVVFIEV